MPRPLTMSAALVLLGGCVTPIVELDSKLAAEPSWEATLTSTAGSTMTGSAAVVRVSAQHRSRVTLAVSDTPPGVVLTWHVHRGACGDDGPVLGPAAAYPSLPVGDAGRAQLVAEMPFALVRGERYYVHLHDVSGRRVFACGALEQAAE